MTLRLNGSTSGYTEIDAPAVAGSNTLVLPTGNGSSGQYLQTNGSGALSWATVTSPSVALTAATSVASTSGTSIDFTSIPSGVKRITVMFNNVSTNGASSKLLQIGISTGIENSGYDSQTALAGATAGYGTSTAGFILYGSGAGESLYGHAVITLMGSNLWAYSSTCRIATNYMQVAGGSKTLSGTLDRLRITTVNGTDTFDAGSINILYEG